MGDERRSDTPEIDELLPRVAAGDVAAFTALFRRRSAEVFRFALHMTGSRSLAEDVTQDVFLAVMRDAGRYEAGRSSEIAWLCGVARNHVRRRLDRERGIVSFDGGHAADVQPPASGEADPLSELERLERIDAVRRAVSSLPLRYREAVVLCDLEEMSYADAASALGCAIGTVRSRLSRGRALLASKLGIAVRTETGRIGVVDKERASARCAP